MDIQIINPELLQICLSNRVEIAVITDTVYFVSAHEMEQGFKEKCRELVPDKLKVDFRVNIKPSTGQSIQALLAQLGVIRATTNIRDKHLSLDIEGTVINPEPDNVWERISEVLQRDRYLDSWDVRVNGESVYSMNPKVFREVQVNMRDRVVSADDIMNLKIDLGRFESVDDFINSI